MKYRNKKTNGYDSKKEAQRAFALKMLERAGEISDLKEQVKFDIVHNDVKICSYIADFTYMESGKKIVEDVKGFKTQTYNIKRKLMKAFYGVEIRET